MKISHALALTALMTIAACSMDDTTTPPTTQAAVAVSHAECSVMHPSTKGNFVDQANCLTDDETKAMQTDATDSDLTKKLEAGRLSLAKRADAGTLTPDQYTARLHKLESKINAQKAARHKTKPAATTSTTSTTTTTTTNQ